MRTKASRASASYSLCLLHPLLMVAATYSSTAKPAVGHGPSRAATVSVIGEDGCVDGTAGWRNSRQCDRSDASDHREGEVGVVGRLAGGESYGDDGSFVGSVVQHSACVGGRAAEQRKGQRGYGGLIVDHDVRAAQRRQEGLRRR